MVERRHVHRGLAGRIDRLHQVDLDAREPDRRAAQMSSSTFSRSERNQPATAQAEAIDPERAQLGLARARRGAICWTPRTWNGRSSDSRITCASRSGCANSRITSSTATLSPARRDDPLRRRRRARRRRRSPSSSPRSPRDARRRAPPAPPRPRRGRAGPASATGRKRERSGGGLNGISARSSAARGVSTRTSTRVPSWTTRSRRPTRSTWARNGTPSTRPWTAMLASALVNEMRRVLAGDRHVGSHRHRRRTVDRRLACACRRTAPRRRRSCVAEAQLVARQLAVSRAERASRRRSNAAASASRKSRSRMRDRAPDRSPARTPRR